MKEKTITLLLFVLAINISISQNTDGDQLFDDSFLHEVRFENVDTNIFLATKDYQQLQMTIDGVVVENVGFKRKGNISGYANPNKFGIKIKTNKYIVGQEHDGTKEFSLHMNFQDPTMMREKLTYDLCADMGLFSLRTAFIKVYINDDYWGLFTLVEGKDEMYKQVFSNRDMDAVESLDFGDMCYLSNNPTDYDYDNNSSGFPYYKFENGNPTTVWPRFAKMIDKANNTPNNQYLDTVSTYLNLEDFFKYQAINVYLMNLDSYLEFKGNQIYVYDTLAKLWQVTPWDFNASFGLWDTNNSTPSTYSMIPNAIANGCIASKMNDIPELKQYYLDAMCLLNNTIGDTVSYFNKIDNWKTQIQQAVYDDTRKHVTNSDFDNGIGYGFNTLFGDNQPALKTFITQRLAVVKQGLIAENYTCQSTIGIKESKPTNNLIIYPNPAKDIITLNFNYSGNESFEVVIYNAIGEIVISKQNQLNDINISHLKSGLYYVVVKNETEQYNVKLIKN